jgi:hypothetical protein
MKKGNYRNPSVSDERDPHSILGWPVKIEVPLVNRTKQIRLIVLWCIGSSLYDGQTRSIR